MWAIGEKIDKMGMRLLSYEDVSIRWQIPINTLRYWVMKKKLRPIKLGTLVRFPLSYIEEIEKKGGL